MFTLTEVIISFHGSDDAASGGVGAATITIVENCASPDLVTVRIPIAAHPNFFARLKVTRP